MHRRPLFVVLIALAVLGVACGSDDEGPASGSDGPAVTVTVTETGHNVATDGFVVPAGEEVEVRFVNERADAATVELFIAPDGLAPTDPRPDDVAAADSRTVEGGADETATLVFDEPGEYRAAVDPVAADPSGVVAGGGTFTVGEG